MPFGRGCTSFCCLLTFWRFMPFFLTRKILVTFDSSGFASFASSFPLFVQDTQFFVTIDTSWKGLSNNFQCVNLQWKTRPLISVKAALWSAGRGGLLWRQWRPQRCSYSACWEQRGQNFVLPKRCGLFYILETPWNLGRCLVAGSSINLEGSIHSGPRCDDTCDSECKGGGPVHNSPATYVPECSSLPSRTYGSLHFAQLLQFDQFVCFSLSWKENNLSLEGHNQICELFLNIKMPAKLEVHTEIYNLDWPFSVTNLEKEQTFCVKMRVRPQRPSFSLPLVGRTKIAVKGGGRERELVSCQWMVGAMSVRISRVTCRVQRHARMEGVQFGPLVHGGQGNQDVLHREKTSVQLHWWVTWLSVLDSTTMQSQIVCCGVQVQKESTIKESACLHCCIGPPQDYVRRTTNDKSCMTSAKKKWGGGREDVQLECQ